MTFRIKYDIVRINGVTEHYSGTIDLPYWSLSEALKQLKWRNPSAKSIKITEHP